MAVGRKIQAVKVLGVRTAEETKILATYNATVYCLLIQYSDGSRSLFECNTKEMAKYIDYIAM